MIKTRSNIYCLLFFNINQSLFTVKRIYSLFNEDNWGFKVTVGTH